MGRLSDKAKQRKLQKKEEKLKLSEYEATVKAAKAQEDPLAKFVPFKKFKSKGEHSAEFTLSCVRAEDLNEEHKEWVFDLTMRNMIHLYENSNWGWDPVDKKEDLNHKDSFFLIGVDHEDVPVGFVCFRFDMDYGVPVAYCYEIQLERGSRRYGLGRHLFTVLELMAFSARMHKVVLTVFHHNTEGRQFFEAMGYAIDESTPGTFDDVGFGEGVFDYDILSKANKRLLAQAGHHHHAKGHSGCC